ncbi:putative AT-hook motif nuclear-localized protein [Helianthus anomalus]
MDSRESLHPPSSLPRHQPHHHHLPPAMMMPPNSYTTHQHQHQMPNSSTAAPASNNSFVTHERFGIDGSGQYGGGSNPPSGFNIELARKKRGRPRKYSPGPDGNIALRLAPAPVTGGGRLEDSNGGGGGNPNADSGAKKQRGRPPGFGEEAVGCFR